MSQAQTALEIEEHHAKGLTSEEVLKIRETSGFNETVAKETPFIILLLKKFIGPVEIILELLALYFFVVAPFIPAADQNPPGTSTGGNSTDTGNSTETGNSTSSTTTLAPPAPWINGVIVVALILLNIIMSLVQQHRAGERLKKLKERLQVTSRAKRDNEWKIVPAREIVPGDIIRLRGGDFVSADMTILLGKVDIDQSALTGESDLSSKSEEKGRNEIFGGSIVKHGECVAEVTHTGNNTLYGKSLELLQSSKPKLHVEKLIARLSYSLIGGVAVVLVIGIIVQVIRGDNVLYMLPIVAVLLASGVPVALPTLITVTLSVASSTLSKQNVLVTRLDSAADAAQMSVLCSDKTGTLTQNKISVVGVWTGKNYSEKDVLFHAALASKVENDDAIDKAVFQHLKGLGDEELGDYEELSFIPFDAATRRTEALVKNKKAEKNKYIRVMKGSVEVLAKLAHLDHEVMSVVKEKVTEYADKGFRTLAVARCKKGPQGLSVRDATSEQLGHHIKFLGIMALADSPREDSKRVLEELKALGIRVIMLTGDSLKIAKHVAQDVGLGPHVYRFSDYTVKKKDKNIDGEKDAEAQLMHAMEDVDGFAEIFPEDKHRIVTILQKRGYVVGMTGDGANDAAALKQAEVGIAVSNATDVAKSAASCVLMEEGLSGVIHIVKAGRQVHQKIATWILNKIAKTFLSMGLIMILYFVQGILIVDATVMIILLFLVDFVTIAIAGDNAKPSKSPEQWRIVRLIIIGCVYGLLLVGESIALVYVGQDLFGPAPPNDSTFLTVRYGFDIVGLSTYSFLILFYFNLIAVISLRERSWFFSSAPSLPLILTMAVDSAVVFVIGLVGIPPFGIAPLYWAWILVVIGWGLVTSILNDLAKVATIVLVKRWGGD